MIADHDAAWLGAAAYPLVPWVGAGVPRGLHRTGSRQDAFTPDWPTFLREASGELLPPDLKPYVESLIDSRHGEEAATAIRESVTKARWNTFLRKSFERSQTDLRPDGYPLLRAIWGVGRGLVLTTNYDPSLAWGSAVQAPTTFGLHAAPDLTTMLSATTDTPVLWHLHGTIQHPDSIVVERTQYDRLYGLAPNLGVELQGGERIMEAAIDCLRTIVATQNLLFLGTSLNDNRVRALLKDVHTLYPEARNRHYLVCLDGEVGQTKKLLSRHGLHEYIELLVVGGWTTDFQRRLRQLARERTSRGGRPIAAAKWIRRRCRTLVAGSPGFIQKAAPILGEFSKDRVVSKLNEMLVDDGLDEFETAVLLSLREEYKGNPQGMQRFVETALGSKHLSELQRLSLRLLYGIALEKSDLGGVESAIQEFDVIIDSEVTPDELRLCARFNRMVCVEKTAPEKASFEEFLTDRKYRFVTGELLWTKAWTMELVRSGRLGTGFPYGEDFDDVVAAEVDEDSTGVAASIANWGHYAGQGTLSDQNLETLVDRAGNAPPTQRVPILTFLASETQDPVYIDRIHELLDTNPELSTLHRFVQTRRVHGRYTLYGEYLMHEHTWGYAAPTSMSLQGSLSTQGAGGIWRPELDGVATLVERLGLRPLKTVSGNLPIGVGFASSTVLGILHVRDQVDPLSRRATVMFLDHLAHGFPPSGMDYEAVSAQQPGFYLSGVWRNAASLRLSGLFVRVDDSAVMSFRDTRKRVISAVDRLIPLADRLTDAITDFGSLDVDAFSKYCAILAGLDIYSRSQVAIYQAAASMGLCSKAIGGLHAQAMLVVGEPGVLAAFEASQENASVIGQITPDVPERWSSR